MGNNIKKNILIIIALVGFISVISINDISAKSNIEFQYDSVSLAENRNFVVTGSAAIKEEVNSGKTVASKAMTKKLAKSNNPADTFRAYYQVNMKNGATYYKVVTMNGKYRGFIKSTGLKEINTLTKIKVSDLVKKQPITLNDNSKYQLWESPKNTQYEIGTKPYTKDQIKGFFKVDYAVRTKIGNQLYYHVTSMNDKSVYGYVYAGKGYLDNQVNSSFGGLSLVTR